MDTITQMILGGVAGQVTGTAKHNSKIEKKLTFAAAIGGLAPDLDVVIKSSTDPLLGLQFHRHFTHSFAFIPIGTLVVTLVLWPFFRRHHNFKKLYMAVLAGFASHALLDATTSYGTMLWWPFSEVRVAWDAISIIDPVYSGLLFIGMCLAMFKKIPKPAVIAFTLAHLYMAFGFFQNYKVLQIQKQLAESRGHIMEKGRVQPSLANLFLWRSFYVTNDMVYSDAIRRSFFGEIKIWQGQGIKRFKRSDISFPSDSLHEYDLRRYEWFTDDYMSLLSESLTQECPIQIGDARYSGLPNSSTPLWGIEICPTAPENHVRRIGFQRFEQNELDDLLAMISGSKPAEPYYFTAPPASE